MGKDNLIWKAKSLGLDTSGTAPELEQRIAIENTKADADILRLTDPDAAEVSMAVVKLRHQLAARATFADIEPDTAKDYFVEEKLDGMRVWLALYNQRAFVYSRHYTKDLRLNAISNINNVNLDAFIGFQGLCVFDAELYIADSRVSRHDRLGLAIAAFSSHGQVKRATPVVFDVVTFNWRNVGAELSYAQRRELMQAAGIGRYLNTQFDGDIHAIFDHVVIDEKGEGLVLKQKDCPYLYGERKGWYKLKTGYADGLNEYNAIITGMGDRGKGRNAGMVGSVTISDYAGNPLGEVGNFTDYIRGQLTDEATGLLKPRLIGKQIEVTAMEITRDGKLRHAAFKRFLS